MVQAVYSGLWGSQGLDMGAMVGLHGGQSALKVTLNMVWVDLVKICGKGGQGGEAEASLAQAKVLSGILVS